MAIYHQGHKVKEVWHQGQKVKEIWHMGQKVFSGRKRSVRLTTSLIFGGRHWTGSSGDTDLISSMSGMYVSFVADVTCDQEVKYKSGTVIAKGRVIPANNSVYTTSTYAHTFTEV